MMDLNTAPKIIASVSAMQHHNLSRKTTAVSCFPFQAFQRRQSTAEGQVQHKTKHAEMFTLQYVKGVFNLSEFKARLKYWARTGFHYV